MDHQSLDIRPTARAGEHAAARAALVPFHAMAWATLRAAARTWRSTVQGSVWLWNTTRQLALETMRWLVRRIVLGAVRAYRGVIDVITLFFRAPVSAAAWTRRATVQGSVWLRNTSRRLAFETKRWLFRWIVLGAVRAYRGVIYVIILPFYGMAWAMAWATVGAAAWTRRSTVQGFTWLRRSTTHLVSRTIRGSWNRAVWAASGLVRPVTLRLRKTTLTISIEHEVVRVVAFRGDEVLSWKSANLGDNRGLPDGVAQSPHELTASSVKRLVEGFGLKRRRVVIDLPLYTPLIRRLRLSQVGRRYLGRVVEAEVLGTIPFNGSEVDISWCIRRSTDGQEVFAVSVPKKAIDDRVSLATEGGASPSAAYSTTTSLAFAAGIPSALIIHVEGSSVSIVRVQNWEPTVVHQTETPVGDEGPGRMADALAIAVDQVAEYRPPQAQEINPGAEIDSLPIMLTGELAGPGAEREMLTQVLRRPVVSLDSPLRYPPGFMPAEYAANLGLYLADRSGLKGWKSASRNQPPGLNLLPKRHLPSPLPVLPAAVFVVLLMLGFGAFVVTGLVDGLVREKHALTVQLDALQRQTKQHREMVEEHLKLNQSLQTADVEAAALEGHLGEWRSDMDILLARLAALTQGTLPPGMILSGLNPEGGGLAVAGTAASHKDVLQYAARVRASGLFFDAQVTGVEGSGENVDGGRVTFRVLATIPDPAVSDLDTAEVQ